MKVTATKQHDYVAVKELRGYDAYGQPSYRLRLFKLPPTITPGFVLNLLQRLSCVYVECVTLERARSLRDAKEGAAFVFAEESDAEPTTSKN